VYRGREKGEASARLPGSSLLEVALSPPVASPLTFIHPSAWKLQFHLLCEKRPVEDEPRPLETPTPSPRGLFVLYLRCRR
jgi:hypothetical protein